MVIGSDSGQALSLFAPRLPPGLNRGVQDWSERAAGQAHSPAAHIGKPPLPERGKPVDKNAIALRPVSRRRLIG